MVGRTAAPDRCPRSLRTTLDTQKLGAARSGFCALKLRAGFRSFDSRQETRASTQDMKPGRRDFAAPLRSKTNPIRPYWRTDPQSSRFINFDSIREPDDDSAKGLKASSDLASFGSRPPRLARWWKNSLKRKTKTDSKAQGARGHQRSPSQPGELKR